MLKFIFRPYLSIFEYTCLLFMVSLSMTGWWAVAFLLLVSTTLAQIVVTRILQKQEHLEQEETVV